MKNVILILFLSVFLLLTSCKENDCDGFAFDVVSKCNCLNSVVLTYFPYKANDTISYSLIGTSIIKAHSTYFRDTTIRSNYRLIQPDCGEYFVDEQQHRVLRFLNETEFGMFEIKLTPEAYNLHLNFKFGSPVNQTYEMSIDALTAVPDTFTVNNKLYIDVFSRIDSANRIEIYYSKSKGLLKILDKNITIFKIL